MTRELIDRAEALAILAPAPNSKKGLWAKRKQALHDAIAAMPAVTAGMPDVDTLSNIIRIVDGNHSLGAGALASAILAALDLTPAPVQPDPAAIREAALMEAHDAIADYPRIAPDGTEAQHYDEQIEHSQAIILALIQKEPTDDRA